MDQEKHDIVCCARCGENHNALEFFRLTIPMTDSDESLWTHWAPCPTNGQPVLLKLIDDEPTVGDPVNG